MLLQAGATIVGAFLALTAVIFYLAVSIFFIIDPLRHLRIRARRQLRLRRPGASAAVSSREHLAETLVADDQPGFTRWRLAVGALRDLAVGPADTDRHAPHQQRTIRMPASRHPAVACPSPQKG